MPDGLAVKSVRVERQRSKKAAHRALLAAAVRKAAVDQEARDERLAPAAQRLGSEARNPRLARDGVSFRVASPLVALIRSGEKRVEAGLKPTITRDMGRAASRLYAAWCECQSVSHGVSSYGERSSRAPSTGSIAHGVLVAVNAQIAARAEVVAAAKRVDVLWPILRAVCLDGVTVERYAETHRQDRRAAVGELGAALKLLLAHYGRGKA